MSENPESGSKPSEPVNYHESLSPGCEVDIVGSIGISC